MTQRRRRVLAGGIAVVLLAVGLALRPHRPPLGPASGDPGLIEAARPLLGEGRSSLSITLVEPSGTRTAHFGADDDTPYEIGSVTKPLTSMLLADAVRRGEVALDDRLGEHLDLGDSPAADVTLAELASHRSGLPRVGGGLSTILRTSLGAFRHDNPYDATPEELVAQARDASVDTDDRGSVHYSNFGAALLGQALAARTDIDYRDLLRTRLLEPLGMEGTTVPRSQAEATTHGWASSGAAAQPWVLDGDAPAGGVRSTAADLGRLITALLNGTAPGADALEPRWDAGDGERIGLAWFTGDGLTWHNGGTGGYGSIVVLDRERGRGVAVLSDTAVDVDDLGRELLEATR